MTKFLALALVLATFTGFQTTAEARSIDPTKVIASVSGIENGIEQAVVLEDGRMQIKTNEGWVLAKTLSGAALNAIVENVKSLSQAEIVRSTSMVVCMMIPEQRLSDLYIAEYDIEKGFGKKQQHVLSASGCWVANKAEPKEGVYKELAKELRAQIRILALDEI